MAFGYCSGWLFFVDAVELEKSNDEEGGNSDVEKMKLDWCGAVKMKLDFH